MPEVRKQRTEVRRQKTEDFDYGFRNADLKERNKKKYAQHIVVKPPVIGLARVILFYRSIFNSEYAVFQGGLTN